VLFFLLPPLSELVSGLLTVLNGTTTRVLEQLAISKRRIACNYSPTDSVNIHKDLESS